jgi:hypothetical protein
MLSDLQALLYLDGRLLANRFRLILRNPRRLLPWLLVLVWIGGSRLYRFASPRGRAAMAGSAIFLPMLTTILPGGYLVLLGIGVNRAALRAPATFRSPADARFLIGSRVPPRLVVGWLQLRRTIALVVVSLFNMLLIVAFVPVVTGSQARLLALFLTIAGAYVTLQALPMAAYFLGRRLPWLPVGSLGVGLAGLGVLSLIFAFLSLVGAPLALPEWQGVLLTLPPGGWIRDAYHGQWLAVFLMIALATAAVAVTVRLSGDCYPELWESSSRLFTLRRMTRERGGYLRRSDLRPALGQVRERTVASASEAGVPPGAGAILWKEWLALRRAPGTLLVHLGFVAGAVVVGAIVGALLLTGEDQLAASIAILGGSGLLMFNVYAGLRLGAELRNPIWWLSSASLRARLLAWTVAGTLRQAIPASLGTAVALFVAGQYDLMLASAVALPAGTWALRVVALVSYALVPSGSDLRGPARLLRVLLFQVCAVPPLLVAVVVVLATRSLAAACLAAAAVVLGEGWLLLELASWLVRRNGVAYARAEAR